MNEGYLGKGTRYPCMAVITAEADNALPTYSPGFILSKIAKITDTPNIISAEAYYDDALEESVSEVRSRALAVDTKELDDTAVGALYGAKIENDEVQYGNDDNPPFIGFAYYRHTSIDGVDSFQGIYYPKAKAIPGAVTHTGKGNAIVLEGQTINLTAFACKTGKNKYTRRFTTEADAKAWVDSKLSVGVYYAVDIAVSGTGVVSPIGTRFVASGGTLAISIGGTVTALYDNGIDEKASIAAGKYTLSDVTEAHNIAAIYTA